MKLSAKNSSAGSPRVLREVCARRRSSAARRTRTPGSPTGRRSRRARPGARSPVRPGHASSGRGSDSTGMNVKFGCCCCHRPGSSGRYRSASARAPQYSTIGRSISWWNACSMHRLDRREAGAAGDEDHRLVGFLAQVERAERPLDAQDLASLVLREQRVGEEAAGHVPDVQLEQRVVVRRRWRARSCAAGRPSAGSRRTGPARYCRRSFAGSLKLARSRRRAPASSIDSMRHGRRLIGMSPARRTSRTSIDEVGRAASRSRTARARRASRRRSASTAGAGRSRRRPSRISPLHVPQAPLRHPYGSMRSAFIAASSTVSSPAQANDVIAGLYDDSAAWRHACARCRSRRQRFASNVLTRSLDRMRRRRAARRVAAARARPPARPDPHAPQDAPKLRAHGIVPIVGDLDDFAHAARVLPARAVRRAAFRAAARATAATIRARRSSSPRSRRRGIIPQRFVYISTSGVYGDCAGARIAETRAAPRADAARASVASPPRIGCAHGRRATACRLTILRAPGIYAATRLPLERITPADAGARARRRRLHEPHPRRRSRARGGRRAVPRPARTARTT